MEFKNNEILLSVDGKLELNSIYQLIFDYSPVGIFYFDTESNILVFNEKFVEILGSQRKKLENFNILRNVKDINIINAVKKCLSNEEVIYQGEYTSFTGNKTVYIRLLLKPLLSGDSKVMGCIGLAEDITLQYRTEQELNLSRSQLLAILDNLPSGVWLKNLEGRYIAVNQKFSEACRKPYKNIIGFIDKDIWGNDLASKIIEEDFKVITAKKQIINRVKFKIFENEQIWEVFKTPVFNNKGEIVGTCGYFTDVKSRIETETALLNEKKYFENLFNNSPDAIVITDKQSNVLRVNKKFVTLFQYDENEIIGKNIDELVAEGKEVETARNITLLAHSGNLTSYEAVRLKKDSTKIDVNILGVPITLPDGSIVVYGIYQDITRQKNEHKELIEAKQKAIESDRIKSNFLANISHELRTPLNGILGFSELLLSEITDSTQFDMINNIHISGNRLLETINSIIDVSIIESDKLNLELTEIDLIDFLEKILDTNRKSAIEKGLQFDIIFNSHVVFKTDRRLFQQILQNIVRNAIKYTKQGKITISISKAEILDNPFLQINVEDTGIGISNEDFDKVFQHFSQVSEGYARNYEGIGLGLTVAKHYVELLDGFITLESELEKGSIFKIFLPLNENDIYENIESFNKKINKKNSILLIEDNKANADYIYFCLKDNYNIEIAHKQSDALKLIEKNQYQVILLDVFENYYISLHKFINQVKENINYLKVLIIALVSNKDGNLDNEIFKNVLTDFISKPFRKDDLKKIVSDNIDKINKK